MQFSTALTVCSTKTTKIQIAVPDTNGKHVQDMSSLHPAQEHDDTNDTERIERQLFSKHAHTDLKRSLGRIFCLHHLKHLSKFRVGPCTNNYALSKIKIENVYQDD